MSSAVSISQALREYRAALRPAYGSPAPIWGLPTTHILYPYVTSLTRAFEQGIIQLIHPSIGKRVRTLSRFREQLFSSARPHFPGQYRERLRITTPDGFSLDGILLYGKNYNPDMPSCGERKVIYFVMGAGGCYEAIADPTDPASRFISYFHNEISEDVDILVLNLEAICESTGIPMYMQWAKDNYWALHFLQERGYKPENTLVFGHSLGAWLSAESTSWVNTELEDSPKVRFVAYNSFSVFADILYHKFGCLGYLIALLASWTHSIIDAFASLPQEDTLIVASEQDETVPIGARLSTGVPKSYPHFGAHCIPASPRSNHADTPGSKVAEKLQQMLRITKVERAATGAMRPLA